MKKFADSLASLAITAWVGGLWGIGYIAVPVLFQTLADRMLAGSLAGKMFELIAYVGMGSACYLLVYQYCQSGKAAVKHPVFQVVSIMLLLTIVGQFWIQPIMTELKFQALPADISNSPFHSQFRLLHGISSILYLLQSVMGAFLIVKSR